jgi:hypothetical protein
MFLPEKNVNRGTYKWAVILCGYLAAWRSLKVAKGALKSTLYLQGSKLQVSAVESTCATEFVPACMGQNQCVKLRALAFEMTGRYIATELLPDNQSAMGKLNRRAGGHIWLSLKWLAVHQHNLERMLVRTCVMTMPTAHTVVDILTTTLCRIVHEMV